MFFFVILVTENLQLNQYCIITMTLEYHGHVVIFIPSSVKTTRVCSLFNDGDGTGTLGTVAVHGTVRYGHKVYISAEQGKY